MMYLSPLQKKDFFYSSVYETDICNKCGVCQVFSAVLIAVGIYAKIAKETGINYYYA